MHVVLTVPHYVCNLECMELHCCDVIAGDMAHRIAAHLRTLGHMATVIRSAQNRFELDDNRSEAAYAGTPLWTALSQVLRGRGVDLVIDVHSYPNGGYGPASAYPVELVVLYYEYNRAVDRALLSEFGPRRYVALQASNVNSIVVTCAQSGVSAVLAEFNEILPDGPARSQAAEHFARAVSSVMH